MTKEKLQALLNNLPEGTLIYLRRNDDAYPPLPRMFKESNNQPPVLYLQTIAKDEDGGHRNFPEYYCDAEEVSLEDDNG